MSRTDTSDNGYHLGQHRLRPGKTQPWQTDINVPFIVRGPGIPAGSTTAAIAGNYDLAPTWLAIATAVPDPGAEEIDGVSLLPLLHSPSTASSSWKRTFSLQEGWWVPWKLQPNGTAPVYTGLRTISAEKNTLYVEFADGGSMFFDLKLDPFQTTNLAASLDRPSKAALAQALAAVRTCRGAGCPGH